MKIIVDEMPSYPDECPFSRLENGNWVCCKYCHKCNVNLCDLLKSIKDYTLIRLFSDYEERRNKESLPQAQSDSCGKRWNE